MQYQIMADSTEINAKNVQEWMRVFQSEILPERKKFGDYYDGKNCIIKQGAVKGRPNYSINVNMAKYIIDVATSYVFGIDIGYDTKDNNAKKFLEQLLYINKNCDSAEVDFQQGGDMSTYGVSYQLILAPEKKVGFWAKLLGLNDIKDRIIFKWLNPEQTFYVVDNTVLNTPICGVYFYSYTENKVEKTKIYVYDNEMLYVFISSNGVVNLVPEETETHNMGRIPILQSLNNDDAFSDIYSVEGILDALSLAISNNTDNLQSIANAILAISGGTLNKEQIEEINEYKVANMPVGATMEWIIKNINPEAEKMQIDNLEKFLLQITQVPDLTDEAFGGNQSGVAMEFKLWGLNQLWATKSKKYTKTLYERMKIIAHLLQYRFKTNVELINSIDVKFSKNLPKDNSDLYQMINTLKDVVSRRTLISQIPFVDDVEEEIKALDEEAEKNADLYGFNNNQNLNGGEDAEEQE